MTKRDPVAELRESIVEMVEMFVPATDARRVISDLDELIEMIRRPKED